MPTGGWWWCSCHRSLSTDHFTRVADPAKLHNLQSLPYFSLTPAVPSLSSVLVPVDSRCPSVSPETSMHPYLFMSDTTPCLLHHPFWSHDVIQKPPPGSPLELPETHRKPSPLVSHRLYQSSSNSNSLLGLGGKAWWLTSCLARERPQAHHSTTHTHQ